MTTVINEVEIYYHIGNLEIDFSLISTSLEYWRLVLRRRH